MHDIFNHEQEIAELASKVRKGTMTTDDYNTCTEIFQALANTAKAITDCITGQEHVQDAPPSSFEKFRLNTILYNLQSSTVEIIKACDRLSNDTHHDQSQNALSGHIESAAKQLINIRGALPPSTRKSIRKKKSKAEKQKGGKAQEPMENNETEQGYYPWFSNNTLLGQSLNDEQP